MSTSPIDRITQVLARTTASGTFATRRSAAADDLVLEVVGVGKIPLPLSPEMARHLCNVARPARYGLRDQTLLDRRVRDACEIGIRQVKIDARSWRRTLDQQLEQIARDLGVPAGCRVRADLHNLLVYGPGQFFATHQDSEKADGMFGTLVVLLPSSLRGGGLVIQHHGEKVSYRGSADRLTFVAFYADCHHEVRPVTAGYRAALTYNLFVESAVSAATAPSGQPLDPLVSLVRQYFATPRPERWGRPSEGPPDHLVYLLDHQYTQKGLGWAGLKNGDGVRAALLREVAASLDCEIVLALADVHETWSCEDDWDDGRYDARRRRRWGYEHFGEDEADEEDGVASEDYTLTELCDSSIELRHWLAPSGKRVEAISGEVAGDEVCYTKATVDLEPFNSEHEGYTGNAGNTVDRWYHRAAVMLWPRARTFAIRAKASPLWAVRDVAKALSKGADEVARGQVRQLRPFWTKVARHQDGDPFVDQVLRVAAALGDPELAAMLVEPIEVERLTPRTAARLADLLERYGLTWCWEVFERGTSRDERGYEHERRATWIASLPDLCGPLGEAGGAEGVELARRVARSQWAWIEVRIGRLQDRLPSSSALGELIELSRAIVGLLATAAIAGDRPLGETIVARLTAASGYPVSAAIAVLRARGAAALPALGALHEHCTRTLTRLLRAPVRAPDDWSITTPIRCLCDLCKRLAQFLIAANERQLDWPLAKERRAHVHGAVTLHEIPLTHVTRRVGSPHVLVLTKTKALFTRESTERKAWARDLAWLREHARAPTGLALEADPGRPARPISRGSRPSARMSSSHRRRPGEPR